MMILKHEMILLKILPISIFIFEDTSWSVLQLAFKYRLFVLSGGTSTKKQYLSALEFRLSLILLSYFGTNDFSSYTKDAFASEEINLSPEKALVWAGRNVFYRDLLTILSNAKNDMNYNINSPEILNILRDISLFPDNDSRFLQLIS